MWQSNDDRIMDIFDKAKSKNTECFPIICPVCGKQGGHLYLHRYQPEDDRGGMWTWCSVCCNSMHTSAKIPKWWQNLKTIDFDQLAALPDYLENNKADIDEWVNKLLFLDDSNKQR